MYPYNEELRPTNNSQPNSDLVNSTLDKMILDVCHKQTNS